MKKSIEVIILVMISCLFMYLLGAFANATFDIKLWSSETRSMISVFMFMSTLFVLALYFTFNSFKRDKIK